jgi:hypothetical protein
MCKNSHFDFPCFTIKIKQILLKKADFGAKSSQITPTKTALAAKDSRIFLIFFYIFLIFLN